MTLVLRLSKLSRRLAIAPRVARRLGGAVLLGAGLVACAEPSGLPPQPVPKDTLPSVDPNDPAFQRSTHIVAPGGRWVNTGDALAPWDLWTALSGAGGRVTPGDTIWIRSGVYRGAYRSALAGTAAAPILVRAWPGERVVLDHLGDAPTTLAVDGPWVTYWGFEVTNSSPVRTTQSTGNEVRPNGIVNNASHTRYINLTVHDAGVAFYNYSHTADVEVYGSTFYNNGWQGPDRGHGHALYVKSDAGPLVLRENVLFNQFGWGVHAYTNQGSGRLNNIRIERNVAFNNGALAAEPSGENFLLGGNDYSTGSVLTENIAWFPPTAGTTNMRIGYGSLANGTVRVADNTVVGGSPVLRVGRWEAADFQANTLAGSGRMVELAGGSVTGVAWDAMTQHRDPLSFSWVADGVASPFALWSTLTGLGLTDLVAAGVPSAPLVRVWPNAYEPGRALIVLLNWSRQSVVLADLSSVLAPGDEYEIHNIQALQAAPVLRGTYAGGLLSLPLGGVDPPVPTGLSSSRAPRTAPDFDVFIVRRP